MEEFLVPESAGCYQTRARKGPSEGVGSVPNTERSDVGTAIPSDLGLPSETPLVSLKIPDALGTYTVWEFL